MAYTGAKLWSRRARSCGGPSKKEAQKGQFSIYIGRDGELRGHFEILRKVAEIWSYANCMHNTIKEELKSRVFK